MINNYTVYNNKAVNDEIHGYIELIVNKIIKSINPSEIKGIILSGSFGQGEGGVLINAKNIHYTFWAKFKKNMITNINGSFNFHNLMSAINI